MSFRAPPRLNEGGRQFGPLHNIVAICIDGGWQTPHAVATVTAIPLETVWFILSDLRGAGIALERAANGGMYTLASSRSEAGGSL